MDFKQKLTEYQTIFEKELLSAIPETNLAQKKIFESMRYSLNAGGKRIRPILLLEFAKLSGISIEAAMPFACAIEMVHTYSLIHDDLPCMDDDELRRGRPTNHIVYGEAIAVLAGDALLNSAFEHMLGSCGQNGIVLNNAVNAITILAKASGAYGMIGGQVIDMEGEERTLNAEELSNLHRLKTGMLIRAACEMGCALGGADEELRHVAYVYAENLGRAFQMQDDILNVEGDAQKMGKDVGNDERSGKSTFVSLNGLDVCKKEVLCLTEAAVSAISPYDGCEFLVALANNLAHRDH